MPLRGGPPPELQQFGQLGGVGQQAPPQVPGLLQMAQAAMDGGGAARGGGGFQSDPMLNAGTPFRQITSPEDQNWSDAQGRPIHMGGPAPSYIPGTTTGGYNAIFDPRAPSAQGGFFTMDEYLKDHPENIKGGGTMNHNNGLSTNNWSLLPPGYNTPDYFMINGQIVSRAAMNRQLTPKSVLGQEGGGHQGYVPFGGGQWGEQVGSQGARSGYAGSDIWANTATPTY
jgi:hypothetical protein